MGAWIPQLLVGIAVLVLLAGSGVAHTVEPTVNVEVLCPIESIVAREGGAVEVVIVRGARDGLMAGGRGTVYRPSSSEGLEEIGQAAVLEVDEDRSRVVLTGADLAEGDMVELPARVPERAVTQVTWELARLGIFFRDEDEQLLFAFRSFFEDPERAHDASAFVHGAGVIRESAGYAEQAPQFSEPAATGRFRGRNLGQAMATTRPEDVRDFLLFVASFPGKYAGQTWRFTETYATWIINDGPTSWREIHLRARAMSEDERAAYLEELAGVLVEDGVVSDWRGEANRLAGEGRYDEAHLLLDLMEQASLITGSEGDLGETWLTRADVLDEEDRTEESIAAYERAIGHLDGNPYGQGVTHSNLGTTLRLVQRYPEAIEHYRAALVRFEAVGGRAARWSSGFAWSGIGRSHEMRQEYEPALEAYRQALAIFQERSDLSGMEREAVTLLDLGDVYHAQGRYREAAEVREQALALARELGWDQSVAGALDKMSDSYWKTGDYQRALDARREAIALWESQGEERKRVISLTNAGGILWDLGDLDGAVAAYEEAIEVHRARGERWDEGDVLDRMGRLERTRGNYAAALELLEAAMDIFEEVGDVGELAGVALQLAEVHHSRGYFPKSDAAYEVALIGYQAVEDRRGEAQVLEWWAASCVSRKQLDLAAERFEASLAIREQLGDLEGQLDTLLGLAWLMSGFRAEHDQALELAERALELSRQTANRPKEAAALARIGEVHDNRGQFDESHAHYQQALALWEDIGDPKSASSVQLSIGRLHERWGERSRAGEIYTAALESAGDDPFRRAMALNALAWLRTAQYRYDEALELAGESQQLFEELDNDMGVATALTTLGTTNLGLGDYREAIALHQAALELRLEWEDPYGSAGSYNNLGTAYMALGDYEAAAEVLEQALEIGRRVQYFDVLTITVGNLATTYSELGQPERTLELALAGMSTAQEAGVAPMVAAMRRYIGMAHRELGHPEVAREMLEESLAEAEALDLKGAIAAARHQLGITAWEVGDHQVAVEHLEEAAALAREMRSPGGLWEPLFYLGRARRDLGRDEAAVDALSESVHTLERMKEGMAGQEGATEVFQADKDDVYLELVALLSHLGRQQEAWEVLGLMKSAELREMDTTPISAVADAGEHGIVEEVQALRGRERELEGLLRAEYDKPRGKRREQMIEQWLTELDEVQLRFQDYVRDLEEAHPHLFDRLQISPPSFFKLQASLSEGEAFLEPLVLPDRVVTFVVRGGSSPLLYRETPVAEAEVAALVQQMRERLEQPGVPWEISRGTKALSASTGQDPTAPSQALYELLIAPVVDDLVGIDTLVFSPSGRLRYVPFAALYDGERYLVETWRLAVLTQAGALEERKPLERDASLLAFGNPDGSLPGAQAEVQSLEEVWPRRSLSMHFGAEATKARLRQEVAGHRVLHLATHGYLLNDNPEASYLLLSGQGQDARLTFREIPLLALDDVDLAVLSACQTAVGDRGEGKEIAGLAYQFEMRGAASVIASLWSVNDASTSALMGALYEQLRGGKVSKAEALRQAQLDLLATPEHSHPYYWAPFLLIGDWR